MGRILSISVPDPEPEGYDSVLFLIEGSWFLSNFHQVPDQNRDSEKDLKSTTPIVLFSLLPALSVMKNSVCQPVYVILMD